MLIGIILNHIHKSRSNKKSTLKYGDSIKTHEDKKWTKKYHDPNPKNKSFGAKVVVTLNNGKKIVEQLEKQMLIHMEQDLSKGKLY